MHNKFLLIILILTHPFYSFATTQLSDRLIYEGNIYMLQENPLELYFMRFPELRPSSAWVTNLSRRYVATFEIIQDELYVVKIEALRVDYVNGNYLDNWIDVTVECLNGSEKMKLDWYFGYISFPLLESDYYSDYVMMEIFRGQVEHIHNYTGEQYRNFMRGN